VVSFPQVSSPKPCMHLSSPPHALHAPPIIMINKRKKCLLYLILSAYFERSNYSFSIDKPQWFSQYTDMPEEESERGQIICYITEILGVKSRV
jgi:hypothetical protein